MKFLFVHQNFPAQFLHLVRHLTTSGQHEVVFITEPNMNELIGVRKVPYLRPEIDIKETNIASRELDNGVRRAEAVFKTAYGLRHLGFEPDIIIGHHGWGEMLNLIDLWPKAPMLGYFEYWYNYNGGDVDFDPEFPSNFLDHPRIRAKNAINHVALDLGKSGQCPTEWQLSTYPEWARKSIELIWEGVDLTLCAPNPAVRRKPLVVGDMTINPADKLVTYVSRDLEPYRGFHTMMRALPALMKRKDVKVVMIGGDGISYGTAPQSGGTWREVMLAEIGDQIDRSRVVFPGRVSYQTYLNALQRSDAHVYLTYPFVASWSLREALAIGCPIVGGDVPTITEFIKHGDNGLITPCLDPNKLAATVLGVLEDKHLTGNLKANARAYAERRLAMKDYLSHYCQVIERLTGENPMPPGSADAPPPLLALPPAPVRKKASTKPSVTADPVATKASDRKQPAARNARRAVIATA